MFFFFSFFSFPCRWRHSCLVPSLIFLSHSLLLLCSLSSPSALAKVTEAALAVLAVWAAAAAPAAARARTATTSRTAFATTQTPARWKLHVNDLPPTTESSPVLFFSFNFRSRNCHFFHCLLCWWKVWNWTYGAVLLSLSVVNNCSHYPLLSFQIWDRCRPSVFSVPSLVFGLQLAPSAGESGDHLHNAVADHCKHTDATPGEGDDVTVPRQTFRRASLRECVMCNTVEDLCTLILRWGKTL